MILEYHRPANLDRATELLARKNPVTKPLAGGTIINQKAEEAFDVVDLQDLALNHLQVEPDKVTLGAMVTLQQIVDAVELPDSLRAAAKADTSYNLRQMATIGGTVAAGNGSSILLSCLSALQTEINYAGNGSKEFLGDLLPMRKQNMRGKLIISIGFSRQVKLTFEKISKTPSDQPILIVCVAQWANGRTRVVVGDSGSIPRTAMDGPSATGADLAAKNLFSGVDEYLFNMAPVLTQRCLQNLKG